MISATHVVDSFSIAEHITYDEFDQIVALFCYKFSKETDQRPSFFIGFFAASIEFSGVDPRLLFLMKPSPTSY